ncbi:alpha/beta fold hydrolase [Nocardia gamkensis]|uniref:alpha/beta fold hydrolase n=1 Tax=Nocardia gamkensis TaxID=352869 RepID=UPI0036E772B4
MALGRDVVVTLEDRYQCIAIDLPLGAHRWPLAASADRSATSLARLLLHCLELLDVRDATVVANDTAGGLLLVSIATDHPALDRVVGLVLTNCETYDHFAPDALKSSAAIYRACPQLACELPRLQLRSSRGRRKLASTVVSNGLDNEREESFFGPARGDKRLADDLAAAFAGFRPELLLRAAEAIPRFDRPVLLAWADSCDFFLVEHAERLAADFPDATLVSILHAKTRVPVDHPVAVAEAITSLARPSDQPHTNGLW